MSYIWYKYRTVMAAIRNGSVQIRVAEALDAQRDIHTLEGWADPLSSEASSTGMLTLKSVSGLRCSLTAHCSLIDG